MSIEELYAQPILQLAREARDRAPVQRPTARATVLSNRFCGDEVRLDVRLEAGLIREIACSVHACVLCEVSALIMRQAMIGKDDSSLAQAEQFMRDLAGGSPVTPPAGWEELGKFEPLRRFKNRLDCVLLPLRALRQALSDHRLTCLLCNSGSISKVEREADERATRHTVIGRRGASEEGDKVIRMKWKWNNTDIWRTSSWSH